MLQMLNLTISNKIINITSIKEYNTVGANNSSKDDD